jgi:predicted nucleic acid-binding protein
LSAPHLVCDAGPLILLAKLDQLDLILNEPGFQPLVPRCVADEILRGPFQPGEEERLRNFLIEVQIESHSQHPLPAGSLSQCDLSSLAWARSHPGTWLLADDRLLRRAAGAAGVKVLGFPGLIIQQTRRGQLSSGTAKELLNEAVSHHQYRISIELYQKISASLEPL